MMRGSKSPHRGEDHHETRILLTSHSQGSDDEESQAGCDYDTALARTGYGRFHYLLMFVCGWANASDAVEILCISFLLPSAECDLELTPARKGWLSAILFVGMMIGGYVWGSLGDTLGRKTVLINAMVVNTVAGLLSSLSQDFYLFMLLRFLSGVGVGGSIPVVWTYYAEFQPSARRGAALSILASFWMIGNLTVAASAWLIIPHNIGWTDPAAFQFNSWRLVDVDCYYRFNVSTRYFQDVRGGVRPAQSLCLPGPAPPAGVSQVPAEPGQGEGEPGRTETDVQVQHWGRPV